MIRWLLIWLTVLAACFVVGRLCIGQEIDNTGPVLTPTDRLITGYLLEDVLQLSDAEKVSTLYVAAPPGAGPNWIYATDFVINHTMNSSSRLVPGRVVAKGHLLAYDARRLAPEAKDLERILELWGQLSLRDPYYHLNQDTAEAVLVDVAELAGAAIVAPHIEQTVAQLATQATFSPALAYRYDFLQDQIFTAADTSLGRGLYYDFLGIPRAGEGSNDFVALLEDLGIDYQIVFDRLGEQRVATFTSDVTSRTRRVDTYIGNAGRRVWITRDLAEGNVDPEAHPIYSLFRAEPDAREVIWELENGLHGFALYDGNKRLQNVVPDNVARDATARFPWPAQLSPGISCVRCHSPDDGLRAVENDVRRLLSAPEGRLRFLFDEVEDPTGLEAFETLDRLEALYGGSKFKRYLDRGRQDYVATVTELIDGARIPPDVSPINLVADEIAGIWSKYRYTWIDARTALREVLGIDPAEEVLLDVARAVFPQPEVFADPAVEELLSGGRISRADWERIYAAVALSALQYEGTDQ